MAVWLGVGPVGHCRVVSTPEGIKRTRVIKRLVESQQWQRGRLLVAAGTPWPRTEGAVHPAAATRSKRPLPELPARDAPVEVFPRVAPRPAAPPQPEPQPQQSQ
eukprot:5561681-Alexandrium_andersonii.AAC.1